MFPETGTGDGMSELGIAPSTVAVNMGNKVAVAGCAVDSVGVIVDSLKNPIVVGEVVGTGFGGFCQTNTNPPSSTHKPITPQPKPLSRNRSKIAKNFLEESIDCFIFH